MHSSALPHSLPFSNWITWMQGALMDALGASLGARVLRQWSARSLLSSKIIGKDLGLKGYKFEFLSVIGGGAWPGYETRLSIPVLSQSE